MCVCVYIAAAVVVMMSFVGFVRAEVTMCERWRAVCHVPDTWR